MTVESSYLNAKNFLKEEKALGAKLTRENILADRTLLRYWEGVPATHVQECLDFLGKFASVNNVKASHSVTDPKVNKEPVPGKWHHAQEYAVPRRPQTEPDVQDIFQFLQLGWVTTPDALPTPTLLTDDKALLSPFAHDTTSVKNAYIWEYSWIDPAYAQTLRDAIALTAGVIDAKVVKVDDGSCKIQVLTQTNTWAGDLTQVWAKETQYAGFAAEKIINTYSHIPLASLAAFKVTLGTATAGYKVADLIDSTDESQGCAKIIQTQEKLFAGTVSASNGTLNEEEYLQLITGGVVRTTMWLGVADADLATAMATVAVAPAGYRVLSVSNNYSGTGSFTLIRVMMLIGDSATPIKVKVEFPSFEDEHRNYYYPGLDKATAQTTFTTAETTCDAGYKIDSVEILEWQRGMLMVVQRISKIMATPAEDLGHVTSTDYEWWGDCDVVTKKWLNIKDADLAATVTLLSTAPSGYSVVSIGHNFDGSGSADIVRVVIKQNLTGFESAIDFPTFVGERKTKIYLGLNDTTSDSVYAAAQTPPAGYKVDSVTKQQGRGGSIVVVQQLSKLNLLLTGQVRAYDYTRTFGLVHIATTIYLSIAKASIAGLKAAILADTSILVLDLRDDDAGQGMANVLCVWRSKEAAPRALGAIRATKASQFHKTEEDRLWIDVNLSDASSLATAVANALAGTAPYSLSASEEVREVTGEDAGDKTGHIRQHVLKAGGAVTPADYSEQESLNPHGLREAVMVTAIREYPDVDYGNVDTIFSSLQSFLGSPAKGRIQVSLNPGKGTFSMRALREGTPDWDNTAPSYVKVGIQNEGLIGESKIEQATGVPVASAAAIVEAATADADHVLEDIQMAERLPGEASITKRQAKKYETSVQVEELPALGLRRATKNYTWPLVLADNVNTVWAAALIEGVTGDWILHYRQKNILGNGMFSITSQIVECTEKKQNFTTAYTDNSIVTVEICQDAGTMPTISDTSGADIKLDGGLNLFGKYDYVMVTVTTRVPRSCPSTITWTTYGSYYTTNRYTYDTDSKTYWLHYVYTWQVVRVHELGFYLTGAEAAAAATGGEDGSPYQVGDNLWAARKVTRADVNTLITTLEEPTL